MKQSSRRLEDFLGKLKDIRIIFDREVSEINKMVAKVPLESREVLEAINKRYNMGIKEEDFKMESQVDSIGEHNVTASFYQEQFQKDFKFFIKVVIREKKKVELQGKRARN